MGDVSRILITGASGFVGAACVRKARAQGHQVIALYRSAPLTDWATDDGITAVQLDLTDAKASAVLQSYIGQCFAVIHAAAHLGGDAAAHEADTLQATQTVLDGMRGSQVPLVLVSSIAVYDTMRLCDGDALDETAPLESADTARDSYTAAKLRQEELCRASGLPLWIMRPGAIYGPGRSWHALMGIFVPGVLVMITSEGELPLTHVDHTAQALVRAAVHDPAGVQVLNVFDDQRPTRAEFSQVHRNLAGWPKRILPIPFSIWLLLVKGLKPFASRLPGLLREPICRARLMPLRFPNTALRAALGGADEDSFEAMMARSLEGAK
jgi:nucleoside-diphosphate-sugar epimerase